MAGQFEIFVDAESNVRFRLVADDGTVLVTSRPFEDKQAAADGVTAVRECAGTGLITEVGSSPWGATNRAKSGIPAPAQRKHRHLPSV